jgi:hypothetical protein
VGLVTVALILSSGCVDKKKKEPLRSRFMSDNLTPFSKKDLVVLVVTLRSTNWTLADQQPAPTSYIIPGEIQPNQQPASFLVDHKAQNTSCKEKKKYFVKSEKC